MIASGFNGPDGMAADAFGNLYLVTAYGAQLVRIRPRGTPEIVLDMAAAGIAYPTSVDLGKSVRQMNTAYIANVRSAAAADECAVDTPKRPMQPSR